MLKTVKLLGKYLCRLAIGLMVLWVLGLVATLLEPYLAAEHFTDSVPVKDHFYIATFKAANPQAFDVIDLTEAMAPGETLLAQELAGNIDFGYRHKASYKVLAQDGSSQEIELSYSRRDYVWTTRYRVTGKHVVPEYRRVFGPGAAVTGGLFSLFATPIVFAIMRILFARFRRRQNRTKNEIS